jgi:hypothetical protein
LAGELDVNRPITKSTHPTVEKMMVMFLDCLVGIIEGNKLNVRVHGLACYSFHDDMNGFIGVIKYLGVAP